MKLPPNVPPWDSPLRDRRLDHDSGEPISDDEWAAYDWVDVTSFTSPPDAHVYLKGWKLPPPGDARPEPPDDQFPTITMEVTLMTLLELYRTLRTPELVALRDAFTYDAQAGADAEFCDVRIKLIERVLREREEEA